MAYHCSECGIVSVPVAGQKCRRCRTLDEHERAPSGEVSAKESCPTPPPALINARWQSTDVKCGDSASMLVDTQNIAAGQSAIFTIKKISDNSTVNTVSVSTTSSSAQAAEVVWKPTDNWGADLAPLPELKFSVSSSGKQADSTDPQLSFHRYADIAQTDIIRAFNSEACSAHPECRVYRIEQRVKVELDDRVFKIHVPIKIRKRSTTQPVRGAAEAYGIWCARCLAVPLDGDGNLTAAEKTTLKNRIEAFYHHKKALHRHGCTGCLHRCARKCCRLEIQVVVHFYELASATPASYVEYWRGSGRADAKNWFLTDTAATNAHEVGHLMGFYDEYTGGAVGSTPWQHPNAGRLMCDLSAGLENYYFNPYATWLGGAARTNESWDVVAYR